MIKLLDGIRAFNLDIYINVYWNWQSDHDKEIQSYFKEINYLNTKECI